MRNIAWHARERQAVRRRTRDLPFGFVQFRLVALDFRKQSGEFCNARCLAYSQPCPLRPVGVTHRINDLTRLSFFTGADPVSDPRFPVRGGASLHWYVNVKIIQINGVGSLLAVSVHLIVDCDAHQWKSGTVTVGPVQGTGTPLR